MAQPTAVPEARRARGRRLRELNERPAASPAGEVLLWAAWPLSRFASTGHFRFPGLEDGSRHAGFPKSLSGQAGAIALGPFPPLICNFYLGVQSLRKNQKLESESRRGRGEGGGKRHCWSLFTRVRTRKSNVDVPRASRCAHALQQPGLKGQAGRLALPHFDPASASILHVLRIFFPFYMQNASIFHCSLFLITDRSPYTLILPSTSQQNYGRSPYWLRFVSFSVFSHLSLSPLPSLPPSASGCFPHGAGNAAASTNRRDASDSFRCGGQDPRAVCCMAGLGQVLVWAQLVTLASTS